MPEPLVCAVMLTKDRPAMARRAVQSFDLQTYPNKQIAIFDTSAEKSCELYDYADSNLGYYAHPSTRRSSTIGHLRNVAIESTILAGGRMTPPRGLPDIFVHWDDDDYSHPNRIAEQVALLQSSGADCVGYRSLLCWDTTKGAVSLTCGPDEDVKLARIVQHGGEAWRYSHPSPSYALGASLCYWRKTWEQRPFQDISKGEDTKFIEGLRMATDDGAGYMTTEGPGVEPSMIIGMHGGNTCNTTDPAAEAARGSDQWVRAPEWAAYCREKMAL